MQTIELKQKFCRKKNYFYIQKTISLLLLLTDLLEQLIIN